MRVGEVCGFRVVAIIGGMKLLEKLSLTPGVSGREHRIRQVILDELDGLVDDVSIDPMGSIIAVRHPRRGGKVVKNIDAKGKGGAGEEGRGGATRVMVAAHMDQIGFLVRHVGDDGFLRVQNVGGFDVRNLFARLVNVETADGDLPGVLNPGGKPVHLASDEERKKIPEVSDLLIDLGLPKETVQQRVKVGDMVTLRAPFETIGQTVVGQCLDNRVACWIARRRCTA